MKRHGVRRYVGNGTPSVLDQRDRPNWQTKVSTFLGFNVTRADIAAFTAAQVDDELYVGAAPAISN